MTSTAEAGQSVRRGKAVKGKSTWFNGHDLKGAACYGNLLNKNVNAQDSWHIAAVRFSSFSGGQNAVCFECVKIKAGSKSIVARIIDDCTGCSANQIDLTASAFKSLAPLGKGVVNMSYEFIRCPSSGSNWPNTPPSK
ncbi:hypothetical protein EDD11_004951 [Mortierella claussenii]|nr:hypothetical protein EDD11_004951 [Mortierella claussenii]